MDTENLESVISSLIEKLDGVGLEIYHLNSSVSNLANQLERIADKLRENE